MAAPLIDLQDAADRLGVHYQTAYKWVRSGRLAADLVHGSYQLDPDAVAAFADQRARPSPPRPKRRRSTAAELSERFFELLIDGDERAARQLVASLTSTGEPLASVIDGVMAPALRRVGSEWSDGRVSVPVEHRASAIVERLLGEHLPTPRGRRRGTVVVAAVSGDRHSLPTSMAAAALREDNWHVHHLGADVPVEDIVQFCEGHGVDLVVLTVTTPRVRASSRRLAARLTSLGKSTLVGEAGETVAALQRSARDWRST